MASKGLKAGDIEALVMIQRIARRMAPEMRKAFLFAVEKAKKKMSVAEIAAAFETRSLSLCRRCPSDVFEEAFGEKGEKVLKQTLKLAGDHAAKRFSSMIPHSVCRGLFSRPLACQGDQLFAVGWDALLDVYWGIWRGTLLSRVLPRTGPAGGLCARPIFDGADFEPGDDSDRSGVSVKNNP